MANNSVIRPVQTLAPFDRTPYIFEKTKIDDFGNEKTEIYYAAAGRKEEFRYMYPDGYFLTEIVELRPSFAVFKCSVYLNSNDEKPYRVAFASRELDASTEIGRRYIECAETAAIGRALANAGIGADALLDDLDGQERKETGGTPIGRKTPDKAKPAQQTAQTAPQKPAAPEPPPAPSAEISPEQMTDEQALAVVISTTTAKSLGM